MSTANNSANRAPRPLLAFMRVCIGVDWLLVENPPLLGRCPKRRVIFQTADFLELECGHQYRQFPPELATDSLPCGKCGVLLRAQGHG